MTQTQKLLEHLAEHQCLTAAELSKISGIPHKNISGLLTTPVKRGLALRCEVIRDERHLVEYRIGTAYTKKAAAALEDAVPGTIKAEEGRDLLRTEPHKDDSAPVEINSGGIKPVHKTHAEELTALLDEIHRLKQQLALLNYSQQMDIASNIINIQHLLPPHITLIIGREDINIENAELDIVLACPAGEVQEAMTRCDWLQARLAA